MGNEENEKQRVQSILLTKIMKLCIQPGINAPKDTERQEKM